MNPMTRLNPMAGLALSCALLLGTAVQAQPRPFDIAAGELKAALDAYAAQSGTQLIYKLEDVRGRSSKGLRRSASAEEALLQLLEGTSLAVRRDVSGAVVIFAEPPPMPEKRVQDEVSTLGTVVVSASRRREPVREVPMQVNVIGGEQLNRNGAKSLSDYLANEAGIDVKSTGGAGVGAVSIRGVSTGAQTIATVGIYVDDVAFGTSGPYANGGQMALDMGSLDLNHIEVLRGPQGTLYGAGAMGGLLKYVTNEPDTYELSGKLSLGTSTTRGGRASHTLGAVVNVPLQEDVAGLRVSAFGDRVGGSTDTVGPAGRADSDGGNTHGARVSLLVAPGNRLKLRLTGTSQQIRRDGTDFVDYDVAGRPVEGERQRRLRAAEPYRVKIDLLSADLEYDFGWARFNAIGSKQKIRSELNLDLSAGYLPLLQSLGLSLGSTPVSNALALDKSTQELRLTSKADKQLEWLAGLYVDHERSDNRQAVASSLPDGTPGPLLATAALPAEYRELALYGDLTWKFEHGLALTGGLRVARNKQHYVQRSDGLLLGGAQSIDADSSDTSRTWLLTARYALDAHSDLYARAATGYRPGGPNAVLRSATTGEPLAPPTFQPDTLTSVEAGYKADLLDQRLSLEAAVYDIRWKDLQQFMPVNGVSVIVNAGAAHVRGAELAASWRPDAHWTLAGNAALIDAKLSEDAPGLGAAAGARLPSSARFAATLSASYAFALAGYPSYLGLTQRYVGQRNAGFEGSAAMPLYRMPAHAMTDLQAGIDFKRASLALFVRNLFDKPAQLGSVSAVQALGGPAWVSLARPRTLGATLTLPF